MPNKRHLKIIKQGVPAWNEWRRNHLTTRPDLSSADLAGANLTEADLTDADFTGANLNRANFTKANLRDAHLRDADLTGTFLGLADVTGGSLWRADLTRAQLTRADLRGADLSDADLSDADLTGAKTTRAIFSGTIISTGTRGLDDLTTEQLDGLIKEDLPPTPEGPEPEPEHDIPPIIDRSHRIVTFSAPVGPGGLVTSIYFRHRAGLNNVTVEPSILISSLGLVEPDVLASGASYQEVCDFVLRNLAKAAQYAGFADESIEGIAVDGFGVLEGTVAGIVTNPLGNLDLETLVGRGVVCTAGTLAVITGEPFFVFFCFAGAIVTVAITNAAVKRPVERMKRGELGLGEMITLAREAYDRIMTAWQQRQIGTDEDRGRTDDDA